jgi:hypothetical protein
MEKQSLPLSKKNEGCIRKRKMEIGNFPFSIFLFRRKPILFLEAEVQLFFHAPAQVYSLAYIRKDKQRLYLCGQYHTNV